jgi:glyoxylase-like metal-dependent hydrolase (beta-lactamase superfamily II)
MHRIAAIAVAGVLTAATHPAWAQSAPDKPAAAPAAEKRPMFETKKVDGTDNVYIFRYGNHQSMFVVTSEGVIATDPIGYGRPQAVETYVAEIKKTTDKPIKYLVYSHHHYDHIAGGKPFKDAGARIIAHQRVKERLEILKDPATLPPDEVFKEKRTLKLGGTVLELSYIGLNHSDSTIVMRLPKEKIVFAVDFIPVGSISGFAMIDSYPLEWEQSLKKLAAMDWERLIPGHPGQPGGRLGTKQDVQDYLEFLQYASAEVKEQAQAGKCWEPAEKEVMLSKYSAKPGHAMARPYVVRRYCGLWGRGT